MFTFCKNLGHQECVYNVIDNPDTAAPKMPLYKSIYSEMVKNERRCNQTGGSRTMGTPHVCLYPPKAFLKKHSRAPISVPPKVGKRILGDLAKTPDCSGSATYDSLASCVPCQEPKDPCDMAVQTGTCEGSDVAVECPFLKPQSCKIKRLCRSCCRPEKPPVPGACSPYGFLDRGNKDFLLDNALDVIRRPAKIAETKVVDQHTGHRYEWCTSGFPRKYVCRKDYGMIPGYLVQRKMEQAQADQEVIDKMNSPNREAESKCRHLEEMERQSLINGLKTNWEELFREFQSLPLMIDNPRKVQKKSELEAGLRDIEKDIQLLERHNHIFVADTTKSFYLA